MLADQAIHKLINEYSFTTVLDIGCGRLMEHSEIFRSAGKDVTSLDYHVDNPSIIKNDYLSWDCDKKFDLVWCSHILEHQRNIGLFLDRVKRNLSNGSILAITVPPLKPNIVAGHVSLWNAGLLMYHLVLAGFDCSNIKIKEYGYNISCILETRFIDKMPSVNDDVGDIEILAEYFPPGIGFQGFNGDIKELNWSL